MWLYSCVGPGCLFVNSPCVEGRGSLKVNWFVQIHMAIGDYNGSVVHPLALHSLWSNFTVYLFHCLSLSLSLSLSLPLSLNLPLLLSQEHKILVVSRLAGDWNIHTCSNCDTDVYITHSHKEKAGRTFVTDKLLVRKTFNVCTSYMCVYIRTLTSLVSACKTLRAPLPPVCVYANIYDWHYIKLPSPPTPCLLPLKDWIPPSLLQRLNFLRIHKYKR